MSMHLAAQFDRHDNQSAISHAALCDHTVGNFSSASPVNVVDLLFSEDAPLYLFQSGIELPLSPQSDADNQRDRARACGLQRVAGAARAAAQSLSR
jgi:hypothetical protein